MKPRIRWLKFRQCWSCGSPGWDEGTGATPKAAYDMWMAWRKFIERALAEMWTA